MSEQTLPALIDIGANLSHESFRDDIDDVLAQADQSGIKQIVVTGTSVENSQRALELALQFPQLLYSTAGIHPHDASTFDNESMQALGKLADNEKVKAIGETGLDFFRDYSPREKQEESFAAHLCLAAEKGLPVFLHQRDAHDNFFSILKEYRDKISHGVVHCFTGDEKELRDYLQYDMYIGITGWVCDERRGHHLHDILELIPPDRLLLETDAPYLLPRPIRPRPKTRRNVPANLTYVLETVAQCLGKNSRLLAEETTNNAKDFFAI